jgi:hypothetical protein
MTKNHDEDIPPHFRRSTSEKALWSRLELRFQESRDFFDMRLETRAEAVGKREKRPGSKKLEWQNTAPRWEDQKAWMLLPYIDALDQQRLQTLLVEGRKLVPTVSEHFEKRELSPRFLHDWGQFCAIAGALELVYSSETDVGHLRSAIAGGAAKTEDTEAHQRWFSHYFLKRYRRGERPAAEKAVVRLVNAIVDGDIELPAGYDVGWFEDFLILDRARGVEYASLRPAYGEHSLSVGRMKELIKAGTTGIPPIDLEIPDP